MRILYYTYGSAETPAPLAPGTALYASVQRDGLPEINAKWAKNKWEPSDYLGHLRRTGSTDLDNVPAAALPPNVAAVENFIAEL